MELSTNRVLITLANGEKYMIAKDHNDNMYEIKDNHLYHLTCERKGFFVFKKWVDVEIDLGEIANMEVIK